MRDEDFSPDQRELIELLGSHGVRYLVVGGVAVVFHGYPRYTGDLDLFYEASEANALRLFAALHEFWAGQIPGVAAPEDLLQDGVFFQFGRPPYRVDLLSQLGSVPFAEAWRNRQLDRLAEVDLPIIGVDEFIQAKRDAGRHKDLADVEELLAIHSEE